MAVTVHPHHRIPMHGVVGIAALGAALTATVAIGFVGVNALTDDGDPTSTPMTQADSSAAIPSDPARTAAPIGTAPAPSSAGSPEQLAFLDQFTVDLGLVSGAMLPAIVVPAMPVDPGVAQGLTDLIPDGDR